MSTAQKYSFIDSDTHITEPADVWTSRVPSKWKDRVPHVRWVEEEKEEFWFIGDKKLYGAASNAMAGWEEPFPNHPPTYEKAHAGAYDGAARLKYMDRIGCWAQTLYPNLGGGGNQNFLELKDQELMLACVRAYNDFQIDFSSPDPRRFIPIMAVPFWDVQETVKEIERCAKKGFKGILFTGAPQDYKLPFFGEAHWDPMWAIAQEADLPISFHLGSGDFFGEGQDMFTPKRLAVDGMPTTYVRTTVNLIFGIGNQMSDVLMSGVLVRYPQLKFVSVESGVRWIPFMIELLDHQFEAIQFWKHRPEFKMKPSEYFRRQIYSTWWFEKDLTPDVFEKAGADHVMFETDFPHITCLYEDEVKDAIEGGLGRHDEALRQAILFDNAAKLYKVERPTT